MNIKDIKTTDTQDMFRILKEFPDQIKKAIEIGENSPKLNFSKSGNKVFVLGMGGSAIGGDILKGYLSSIFPELNLRVIVNRSYDIPGDLDENSFVIASSYSGNTEETIESFKKSFERTKNAIVISTGGELTKFAKANGIPLITLPDGLQPRCAIGYSFVPMMYIMSKSLNNKKILDGIQTLPEILEEKSAEYSNLNGNFSIELAERIKSRIPVVYSSEGLLRAINLRWRGQIQENAKSLAFGGFYPEMNHNEINSFANPESLTSKIVLLNLKDISDHKRTGLRFNACEEILSQSAVSEIVNIQSFCSVPLHRMFDVLYLGDWVSYYLAILNGLDPTPIPSIMKLKAVMEGY